MWDFVYKIFLFRNRLTNSQVYTMDQTDILDYEECVPQQATVELKESIPKGSYSSIHSSSFKDFLLKPELLRAIIDCGFEHPSEVQYECIPQAM